jgi:Zn2+/Cd2+-exporting ATPase
MTTLSHPRPYRAPQPRLSSFLRPGNLETLFVALTLLGLVGGLVLEQREAAPLAVLTVHVATYFFGGAFALRAVAAALRQGKVEVDLLMVLAALGAAYIGAWSEGATLLFLFSLSNVLQTLALDRTTKAISALMALRPDTVAMRRGERVVDVALDAVRVGDVMVLRPGDRVALDAIVVVGNGNLDESTITGEALPVQKAVGDALYAGTLNVNGAIDARVVRPASESTLARIVAMVSAARERKARSQRALDHFEQGYVVLVLAAVALYAALVPLFTATPFAQSFYTAMVLLTVASPCALVISVPAALLSAIANAARNGVLFKGGAHLENLSRVQVIALDKTGILTYGQPAVAELVAANGIAPDDVLRVAARAEQPSEHPLALAVRAEALTRGMAVAEPDTFEALVGLGVKAAWDGQTALVGSLRLLEREGIALPDELLAAVARLGATGRGSTLLVARGGQALGLIVVADRERPDLPQKIAELRAAGITRVVMLTGDNRAVAEAVAQRAGIDEVYAELLPGDKQRIVEQLEQRYGPTAMVGDGINDAPALAAATSSIAMGAAGTDVAIETADIVLMSGDLGAIAYAVRLSKRARRIVWQNIVFALLVAALLVVSTLSIGLALPLGVVGHEGSTLLVVLNGLRLLGLPRR